MHGRLRNWHAIHSVLILDYVRLAFDEFDELAGDRAYADDKAIVGGIARLDGRPVMIIGHQKGRETKEKFAVTLVCQRQKVTAKHCV